MSICCRSYGWIGKRRNIQLSSTASWSRGTPRHEPGLGRRLLEPRRRSITTTITTKNGGHAPQSFAIKATQKASFSTTFVSFQSSNATTSFKEETTEKTPDQEKKASYYKIDNETFQKDQYSNTPSSILDRTKKNLYLNPKHPLGILKGLIEKHLSNHSVIEKPNPIVTIEQNFDELGFPKDHPGRSMRDSYYLNENYMLRTHTSAHEVEAFKNFNQWLLTADVYRRDEIDSSHYPVFHQVEAANIVPLDEAQDYFKNKIKDLQDHLTQANIIITDDTQINPNNPYQSHHDHQLAELVTTHLKLTLNSLVLGLFGPALPKSSASSSPSSSSEPLRIRWIEANFPFTSPSYEVEIWWQGQWLEILGTGVVRQATLDRSGRTDSIGWAFGLGLERIAMILFQIPDIRLFWSEDSRFLSQFYPDTITTFKPYSRHEVCYKDISFWCPQRSSSSTSSDPSALSSSSNEIVDHVFQENDFYEIVREMGEDTVEDVNLIDEFIHPKTGKKSLCYRINYRSMDRNLTNDEVNVMHSRVVEKLVENIGIQVR